MDFLINACQKRPLHTLVVTILSVIISFKLVSGTPLQITPSVDSKVVSVKTSWEGASLQIMESQIVQQQLKYLNGIEGISSIVGTIEDGKAQLVLDFAGDMELEYAKNSVLQKLTEVPGYPEGALPPTVEARDPRTADYMAWLGIAAKNSEFDSEQLRDFVQSRIRPLYERLPGVGKSVMLGGKQKEVHIKLLPNQLEANAITYKEVLKTLKDNGRSISAGKINVNDKDVKVVTKGDFDSIEALQQLPIKRVGMHTIRLSDIADVTYGVKVSRELARSRGIDMSFLGLELSQGANLIATMEEVKKLTAILNQPNSLLNQYAKKIGQPEGIEIVQVWDTSTYVEQAIDSVVSSLIFGGFAAVCVLFVFMRSRTIILVTSLVIPISVLLSFSVLILLDRSINLITLIGMAFSVGLVIDNSIVVIESIRKQQEAELSQEQAISVGITQVYRPLLYATATTVMVFLPILFIDLVTIQLFADLAYAIMVTVFISLLLSVLVIPVLFSFTKFNHANSEPDTLIGKFNFKLNNLDIRPLLHKILSSKKVYRSVALGVPVFTILFIFILLPPADFLPKSVRNAIVGVFITQPGFDVQRIYALGDKLEDTLVPAWHKSGKKFAAEKGTENDIIDDVSAIKHYFLVSWNGVTYHAAIPENPDEIKKVGKLLEASAAPHLGSDIRQFIVPARLFKIAGSNDSLIEVDIQSGDYNKILDAAGVIKHNIVTNLDLKPAGADPSNYGKFARKLEVNADPFLLKQTGLNYADLGEAVAINSEGMVIRNKFHDEFGLIDLRVMSDDADLHSSEFEKLNSLKLINEQGQSIALRSLSKLNWRTSLEKVKIKDGVRTVTLKFRLPDHIPMQLAVERIELALQDLHESGKIDPAVNVELAGTAGRLNLMLKAIVGDGSLLGFLDSSFFLSNLVIFFLLILLFKNVTYSIITMITIPLAMLGGVIGLRLMNVYSLNSPSIVQQNMDVLTMFGFLILFGVVVNNAILIIFKFKELVSEFASVDRDEVIINLIGKSAQERFRAILMSLCTSIAGMLPMLFITGQGSELYRGVASVVIGGLLLSTFFTLILIPVLLLVGFKFSVLLSKFNVNNSFIFNKG